MCGARVGDAALDDEAGEAAHVVALVLERLHELRQVVVQLVVADGAQPLHRSRAHHCVRVPARRRQHSTVSNT